MDFLDLKDISEQSMELINPTSIEKVLFVGTILNLKIGQRIMDFGCGFGEMLALWGEAYGIGGVGIDIRPYACQRARQKMLDKKLSDRITILYGSGSEYQYEPNAFDVAVSLGSTFIWGGFGATIRAMSNVIHKQVELVIGEPYWLSDHIPPAYRLQEKDVLSEIELLQIAHKEGFDIEYIVRASQDDWDRYECSNWQGLLRWIEANPTHPERQQVIDHLHQSEDEYMRYSRQYFGWAIYILNPIGYK